MSKPLISSHRQGAIDFNPTDMYMPLSESSNFNKYVGGSPANIAVGLARLGCKLASSAAFPLISLAILWLII
jgi:sugar/nucleoside kinase (ribokinase family)